MIVVQEGEGQPQQQQQQQARVGGWALFKTLLIRMFFIYMISSLFRRGTQPQQPSGSNTPANTGAFNIFLKDTAMVCCTVFLCTSSGITFLLCHFSLPYILQCKNWFGLTPSQHTSFLYTLLNIVKNH